MFLQLAAADLQTTMNAVPQAATTDMDRSLSVPSSSTPKPAYTSFSASLSDDKVTMTSLSSSASKGKGMQLGHKVTSSANFASDWAEEAAAEAEAEEGAMHHNPWGNDDLMDVNADQDDWSKDAFTLSCIPSILMFLGSGAFESAPTPAPAPSSPNLGFGSPNLSSQPRKPPAKPRPTPARQPSSVSAVLRSPTPSDSTPTPSRTASPAPIQHHTMSKEEKAAEMARRKEERKQVRA